MKTITKSLAFVASLFCFLAAGSLDAIWSPTVTLDTVGNPGSESATQIAVDPNGNAVAAWVKTHLGSSTVNSETLLFGGSWSSVIPVGPTVQPSVAVDASGNAVLVWITTSNHLQGATLPL